VTANQVYNQSYLQMTPAIGYRLFKKLTVGIGPDFQQALVDNRPSPPTLDRDNIQQAPLFDIGFVGKTEFAFSPKLKAAVCYREGINNIITPMNRYTERNYVQ